MFALALARHGLGRFLATLRGGRDARRARRDHLHFDRRTLRDIGCAELPNGLLVKLDLDRR